MSLILHRPWTRQPQGYEPAAAGVSVLISPGLGYASGCVLGGSTAVRQAGPNGVGLAVTRSNYSSAVFPAVSGGAAATTAFVWTRVDGLHDAGALVSFANGGAMLVPRSTGYIDLWFQAAYRASSASAISAGTWCKVWLYGNSADGWTVRVNGVSGSPGGVGYGTTGLGRITAVGGAAGNGGATQLCMLAAGFPRPLSVAEMDAIDANPWQLFEPRRIWVPVSAAGGSHSGALAESGSASDSATAAAAWLAAVAEPASAADLTAALLAMVAAASETGSAADSIDALRALLAGASDSGAAEDAAATLASLLAAVNESGAAADAQDGSTGSGHSGAAEEAASAADTATAIAALLAASSESVSVSDAASAVAALLAAVAEAGSAADVADWVAGSAHSGAVSEAGAILEAAAAAAALVGAMQDAGIVDELAAAIADYRSALAEAVQLQDVVAAAAALLELCAIVWAAPAELRTFVPPPETRTWVAPPEQRTYAPPPYPVEDLS